MVRKVTASPRTPPDFDATGKPTTTQMPMGSASRSGSSSSGSGSAELEATYFAMGILLAFIGNVGLNVGTNVIAPGHDQKAKGRTFGMLVRAFSEL
jgi:hypothetical protein